MKYWLLKSEPNVWSIDQQKKLVLKVFLGMVGLEKFKLKQFNGLDYPAKPRWALDENAAFLKGAGVRL